MKTTNKSLHIRFKHNSRWQLVVPRDKATRL